MFFRLTKQGRVQKKKGEDDKEYLSHWGSYWNISVNVLESKLRISKL